MTRRTLIQASEPAGRLARLRPRLRMSRRGLRALARGRATAVTLIVLPIKAICTIAYNLAFGGFVVFFQHVTDHEADFVLADVRTPAKVFDGVVSAFAACVADGFHSVAGVAAGCACAHVDWVSGMSEVETACAGLLGISRAHTVAWGRGQAET